MGLTIFQIGLTLSFLVTLAVVVRLFKGVQILNARVGILSNLVRELRERLEVFEGQPREPTAKLHSQTPEVDLPPTEKEGDVSVASEPAEQSSVALLEAQENAIAGKLLSEFGEPASGEGLSDWDKESKLKEDSDYDFAYNPNSWSLYEDDAEDGKKVTGLQERANSLEEKAIKDFGAGAGSSVQESSPTPQKVPRRRRRVSASLIQEKSSAQTDVRFSTPSPRSSGMFLRKQSKRSERKEQIQRGAEVDEDPT